MCGDGQSLTASRAHSLQDMLILMKLLGATCWKTRSSPIIAVLCYVSSKSPSFFNLDNAYYNTTGITYKNYNSDNRQWQDYLTINCRQFIYGLFSPKIKSLWGTHRTSPSFRITHQVHSGPWAKAIPWTGLPLPEAGLTQTVFPNMFRTCTTGTLPLLRCAVVLTGQDQPGWWTGGLC